MNSIKRWTPVLSPRALLPTLLAIGVFLFIPAMFSIISQPYEAQVRYDDQPMTEIDGRNHTTVTLTIEEDLQAPVFFYYGLTRVFQDHRSYSQSVSPYQLKGGTLTSKIATECFPDTPDSSTKAFVFPCGLIAKSRFNDTFSITAPNGTVIDEYLTENGISWPTDHQYRFSADHPVNESDIVWMRVAALPRFKKPYRKWDPSVEEGGEKPILPKGEYRIDIESNYPVKEFDGEKYFVVGTVDYFGGRNTVLRVFYVIVASVFILTTAILAILAISVNRGRKYARMKELLSSLIIPPDE